MNFQVFTNFPDKTGKDQDFHNGDGVSDVDKANGLQSIRKVGTVLEHK